MIKGKEKHELTVSNKHSHSNILSLVLTVAATKITALGFLGIGKRVTSVRDSTFRIRSLTSSRVIAAFCTARSSLSASHAVACFNIPSQNATTAECGERKGRVATGVGCRDPTIAACTPPNYHKSINANEKRIKVLMSIPRMVYYNRNQHVCFCIVKKLKRQLLTRNHKGKNLVFLKLQYM